MLKIPEVLLKKKIVVLEGRQDLSVKHFCLSFDALVSNAIKIPGTLQRNKNAGLCHK